MMLQGAVAAAGIATAGRDYSQLAVGAAAIGANLLNQKYSRGAESESDYYGMQYMARAGYDPRESVALWENFEALGGDRPPEFLSTHPAEGTRIARLQKLMPQALEVYEQNRARY